VKKKKIASHSIVFHSYKVLQFITVPSVLVKKTTPQRNNKKIKLQQ